MKFTPKTPNRLATKTKLLKSGAISETSMQEVVMQFVAKLPLLRKVTIHIPNEGLRSNYYGKQLKSIGMRAGVADLFIALPRNGYHGAWLELKSRDGLVGSNQQLFLDDMALQGYYTKVCWSVDDALNTIQKYAFGVAESKI